MVYASFDCLILFVLGLWALSGGVTCITGPLVLYRIWQWDETVCETTLLTESALCKNCEIEYIVDDEPHPRICPKLQQQTRCQLVLRLGVARINLCVLLGGYGVSSIVVWLTDYGEIFIFCIED